MAKKDDFDIKNFNELNDILKSIDELNESIDKNLSNQLNKTLKNYAIRQKQENIEEKIRLVNKALLLNAKNKFDLTKKERNEKLKQQKIDIKTLDTLEKQLKSYEKSNIYSSLLTSFLKSSRTFLMEADYHIKSVNRELGLSAERSEQLRQNIYQASFDSAVLGGNIKDLSMVTAIYADETGRARINTKDALLNIMEIGYGTGLGIEQAARLAGQFELMGVNAKQSAEFVQGVVDTSERMGVNTTKVLKNISENFKSLQKFTFRQGVKGFAEMAIYAEKFKVDMGSMLDSAEKARTLEGAIELAAKMQVMGGEFAKADPFQTLFLSRNDPAQFTKKINEMTKGIATFRKNAEGTFETFVSPLDIDRLEQVGKALGMQKGELVEQARRMAEIQRMRQQMIASNFGEEQKEAIEGLAKFNSDTGKFFVEINGAKRDLSRITQKEADSLVQQSKTLKERAEAAKTFDKTLGDTIILLKSTMLPVLDSINWLLENGVNPIVRFVSETLQDFDSTIGKIATVALGLTAGALAIKGALKAFNSIKGFFGAGGGIGSSGAGGGFGKAVGGGLGAGLAGAGIGAGIGMAAQGLTSLSNSLQNLDDKQLKTLKELTSTLSKFIGGGVLIAAGLATVSAAFAGAAPAMYAFGGAVALIGAGIGIASAGIGYMANSIGNLASDEITNNLPKVATGLAAIMGAASTGGLGSLLSDYASIAKLAATTAAIAGISSNADDMERVGNAFKNIAVVMQGSTSQLDEIRKTINAISSAELSEGNVLVELKNLLSKPLQVEFKDKEVGFNASINLNVDGNKLYNAANISKRLAIDLSDKKGGKSGGAIV